MKKILFFNLIDFSENYRYVPIGNNGKMCTHFSNRIFNVTVSLQHKHEYNNAEVEQTSQIQAENKSHVSNLSKQTTL